MIGWDVFISHAGADSIAAGRLRDELLTCSTLDGRRPTVFLDTSPDGVLPGENWVTKLEEVLRSTRFFVPLYSESYFERQMCEWELQSAFTLTHSGQIKIVPVLINSSAIPSVPMSVSRIQWQDARDPIWFDRVRDALDLLPGRPFVRLRFASAEPPAQTVNLTLPEILVEVMGENIPEVEVVAETPSGRTRLVGTTVRPVRGRRASFPDLSFPDVHERVQIVAQAPGCESTTSDWFRVDPVKGLPKKAEKLPTLAMAGRPFFLPDGERVAVVGPAGSALFEPDGSLIVGMGHAADLPKVSAVGDGRFATVAWSGQVVMLTAEGRSVDLRLPGRGTLNIPCAAEFDGPDLIVGMWNGTIWKIPGDGGDPMAIAHRPEGAQGFTWSHGSLLIVGMDGTVRLAGSEELERRFERVVLGFGTLQNGHLLAVGEKRLHRLNPLTRTTVELKPLRGAHVDHRFTSDGVAVLDEYGSGVLVSSELSVRRGFQAAAGARFLGSDHDGEVMVFTYPGGSSALMVSGRVVFMSADSPMAVSPDGSKIALADDAGVRIIPREGLGR
ncbi:toll/interleukin-1 receptor domain-containing protein [Nonomuraea sp. NPDC050328]|uniref:toll/interleukin-1 receptor domain-containing protein n=1 Tax=Nonomuraea sp. NPDC050328 TaxID=3364361 RepID=UPI0037B3B09C